MRNRECRVHNSAPIFLNDEYLNNPIFITIQKSKFTGIGRDDGCHIFTLEYGYNLDTDPLEVNILDCLFDSCTVCVLKAEAKVRINVDQTTVKDSKIANDFVSDPKSLFEGNIILSEWEIKNTLFSNNDCTGANSVCTFYVSGKSPFVHFYNVTILDIPFSNGKIFSLDFIPNVKFDYCIFAPQLIESTRATVFDIANCKTTFNNCCFYVRYGEDINPFGHYLLLTNSEANLAGTTTMFITDRFTTHETRANAPTFIDPYQNYDGQCPALLPSGGDETESLSSSDESKDEESTLTDSETDSPSEDDKYTSEVTISSSEEEEITSSDENNDDEKTTSEIETESDSSLPTSEENASTSSDVEESISTHSNEQESTVSPNDSELDTFESSNSDKGDETNPSLESTEFVSTENQSTENENDETTDSSILDWITSQFATNIENTPTADDNDDDITATTIFPTTETEIIIPTPPPPPIRNETYLIYFIRDKCFPFLELDDRTFCYTPSNVTEIDLQKVNSSIEKIFFVVSTQLEQNQMIAFSGLNNEHTVNSSFSLYFIGTGSEHSRIYLDLASDNNIFEMSISQISVVFVGNKIDCSILKLDEDLRINNGKTDPKTDISRVNETSFKYFWYYDYFIINPDTEQTIDSGEFNVIDVYSDHILFNSSAKQETFRFNHSTNRPIHVASEEEQIKLNVYDSEYFVILSLRRKKDEEEVRSPVTVNAQKSSRGHKFGIEMKEHTVSLKYSSNDIPVHIYGSGTLIIETEDNVEKTANNMTIQTFSINNKFTLSVPNNKSRIFVNQISMEPIHRRYSSNIEFNIVSQQTYKSDFDKNGHADEIQLESNTLIIGKNTNVQINCLAVIKEKLSILEEGVLSFSKVPVFSPNMAMDITYSNIHWQKSPIITLPNVDLNLKSQSIQNFNSDSDIYENIAISKLTLIRGSFSLVSYDGSQIEDQDLYLDKIEIIPMSQNEYNKVEFIDENSKYVKKYENNYLCAELNTSNSKSNTTTIIIAVVISLLVVVIVIAIIIIIIKRKRQNLSNNKSELDTESTSFSL
ncbi:hypothetical protein TRFO_30424 [Tritrichomonas foetus]|uniref:Uncharacterized protein n=1 Tax=Tritrichomonas foetus TaxID=1144522 RepID=A0A1J4JTW0_9EUKA|nr:hypothetical protein TRFO_30424 [Tritrichomonas foetus]|eukprot:OHT02475.1 hypothetical protein TRFO_30424 [Tritrichomonas foetus]